MTAAFDVIVCGSLHLDIVVDAPHLPRLDETVPGTHWKKVCGGKGGNQAMMAARAGARTAMISRVGNDDFGITLVSNLKANAVDVACVSSDPTQGTGMSVAIVDSSGEYGAVIVSGSNLALQPEFAAADFRKTGRAAVLVLQNEIPEAVNIAIARTARDLGTKVILNAAPARTMSDAFLQLVDLLVVNRVEAEMLSGMMVSDVASATAALPYLNKSVPQVIITLGGQGLVFKTKQDVARFIPPVKVVVKSTHGAGDCFVGVLANALAKGLDLATACALANQSAAKFVGGQTFSTLNSVPL